MCGRGVLLYDTHVYRGSPPGIVVNELDYDIVVCSFEINWSYYIHFRFNTLGNLSSFRLYIYIYIYITQKNVKSIR